jgi:nitrogen regulatory protein P-II 1
MKQVTVIVRTTSLNRVVQSLEHAGVRGMTITQVKGIGEEVRLDNPYAIHDKVEIIVPDEKTDAVVKVILENTRTGLAGDGIITVHSLDYAASIRTAEKME